MKTSRFHPHLLALLALALNAGYLSAGAPIAPPVVADGIHWPQFRGADGSGVYRGDAKFLSDLPASLKVAWTAEVPLPGFGSPVVWGDRVFLSGGDEEKSELLCFDATSGRQLWETAAPKLEGRPEEKFEIPDQCGMAAATVAVDGERVYAMFANGQLLACTFDGATVWTRSLAVPKNAYGHASSLVPWHGRLILQYDQGEADDHLSKLYELDGASGKSIWAQPRPVGSSWATPLILEAAGKSQIVTAALPWVIAYAAQDGAELWRAECLDGEVTPSPVALNGAVLAVSPSNRLQVIRPDGHGDVTKTHLGWMAEDGVPDVTSPVTDGELVFVVDAGGTLTCYEAKEGRKLWQHDLGDACNASPSIASGHVLLLTKQGQLVVVDAAREFHESGRTELGEAVYASPAFGGGRMFVRGVSHLICLGGS